MKSKVMSILDAVLIIDGIYGASSEEQLIAAWQHLVDTGAAWALEGRFGRQATRLIKAGIIRPAHVSSPHEGRDEEAYIDAHRPEGEQEEGSDG